MGKKREVTSEGSLHADCVREEAFFLVILGCIEYGCIVGLLEAVVVCFRNEGWSCKDVCLFWVDRFLQHWWLFWGQKRVAPWLERGRLNLQ